MGKIKQNFRHLTKPNYGKPAWKQHQPLQELTKPHIESFNYMLKEGLPNAIQKIPPVEFALPNGARISLHAQEGFIGIPSVAPGNQTATTLKVYPAECRERGITYRAKMILTVSWSVNSNNYGPEERNIGEVPIMVKSDACNLAKLTPAELINRGEEAEEMGGYFIINGIERIIRMLIMQRRNYPTAVTRPSWKGLGPQYTEFGVSIRCVADDQTSVTNVLHYLNNGSAVLMFSYKKEQFFVPIILILKALVDVTDQFLYNELIKGKESDSFYKGCVTAMLRLAQNEGLGNQSVILKFIGERFRIKLDVPEWYTDREAASFLLKQCLCIHLNSNMDKLNLMIFMTRKLFTFSKGECCAESPDNPMFQELLLGGHLYLMLLKEKVESWLLSVKSNILMAARRKGPEYILDNTAFNDACSHATEVTRAMEYLLATGNLQSKTGLGLMQASGLTVVADKLNFFRYLSHFRCVHRGAFFAEMRTTAVRKLLPEAWGFLCPVHTPDGAPCGLLNHMSALCKAVNDIYFVGHLPKLLCQLGMTPYDQLPPGGGHKYYPVLLNGATVGWISDDKAQSVAEQMRTLKVLGKENIPPVLEVCLVPKTHVPSQYPGLFLFSTPARMVRPVHNLALNTTEMIGTFEQVYLNICVNTSEGHEGITTHCELREDSMLSCIASLTPFSDFNQSPRNMYQCQMGKQTMGTPLHAITHRSDNKLYRIQTPQAPMVRPSRYDDYQIDDYPLGTNAVVAVISYTGYDMEDAMILNKASYERGFAHGSVYKCEFIDLQGKGRSSSRITCIFGTKPGDKRVDGKLHPDGLPPVGAYLTEGDPYYSYINIQTGESRVVRYKSTEPAYVDQVKILGGDLGTTELQRVAIMLRIERNPIIGDKFASRHGQKGICSQRWPVEDMPFSESGMTPDIIFNPHGFPSRMTIGMMIESMAGKSAAMHGLLHDATPFTFSEDSSAIEYFSKLLTAAGYNYYGTERMYSGINGKEFEADIFMGIVYYQRLRHMVSDKFQVRTTGPIDQVTHQPIKGRKRGGGIRFGEMERDGLLAHGTSFLLEDRLLNCSDKSQCFVCAKCGSLLSPLMERAPSSNAALSYEIAREWHCKMCDQSDTLRTIQVPYVFRYLVAELAAMNIKVTLDVEPAT